MRQILVYDIISILQKSGFVLILTGFLLVVFYAMGHKKGAKLFFICNFIRNQWILMPFALLVSK